MQRHTTQPRPDWRAKVESQGFAFHTTDDGRPYWDESAYYQFTAREVDTLEAATYALDEMCLAAVDHVIANEGYGVGVELRGRGTQCVGPGSLHKSGNRYVTEFGDPAKPPVVPLAVFTAILAAVRTFDEGPATHKSDRAGKVAQNAPAKDWADEVVVSAPVAMPHGMTTTEPEGKTTDPTTRGNDEAIETPWGRYNSEATADTTLDLLRGLGWTDAENGKVIRPGKDGGVSGSVSADGAFYSFTTSDSQFENCRGYSPFEVYAIANHRGDIKAAGRALSDRYGLSRSSSKGEGPAIGSLAKVESVLDKDNDMEVKVYAPTDLGNAEFFAYKNEGRILYVTQWKTWLIWDGRRWARDETNKVRRLALSFVKVELPRYVATIKDHDDRIEYLKWLIKSQSESKVDAMISLASSIMSHSATEFDANGNLFNVSNGTIELDTLKFRPHNPLDLCTKISPVSYDPNAVAPIWDRFLNRIFLGENGEQRGEVIDYIRRAVGYSMTTDVSAQCLFVAYGGGRNGKTTMLDLLRWIMGEYAMVGQQSLLLDLGNNKSNSEDEVRLKGIRMVACSEITNNQKFDEGKVKRLTGNETIRARDLYEKSIEFDATHKIWLDCNHKPKVMNDDEGIWRRIKLIPFLQQISYTERDPHLGAKLKDEASGVLNWMLKGLGEWIDGAKQLIEPKSISEAVGDYRKDADTFGRYLSDCIENNDIDRVSVDRAYASYIRWCEDNGMARHITKIEFGRRMTDRGYKVQQSNSKRYYLGCSILERSDRVEDESVSDPWA